MSPRSLCCICRKLVFTLLHRSFCCSGLMVHLQLLCLALSQGSCVTWIEQMLASSDVMQPLRQAYVASGLGQGLRHLMHFRQNNGFGNRPRERPERPWSHRKCPSGDPGAFWSVSAASGRCPSDLRGTPEAAPKPPSTAPGVPQGAQGTPKDAAEAPRAASDWLFLVAEGPLDSSPALLQKSAFYGVKS